MHKGNLMEKIVTQSDCGCDLCFPDVDLLSPLQIKGITLRNRTVLSPMRRYCSKDSFANDRHRVHLGSRALGGAGLVFTKATAVTPQGRISPGDLGIKTQ